MQGRAGTCSAQGATVVGYCGAMRTPWWVSCLALLVIVWPREGIVGTYGTFVFPLEGFSIAQDITIGSHSDHAREGPMLEQEQQALLAATRPHAALYQRWFSRVLAKDQPYADWLGALDVKRRTALQWDYKARFPAPLPVTKGERPLDPFSKLQVYVHLAPKESDLAHARAVVGFTLAQLAAGDVDGLAWPAAKPPALSERLARVGRADSYPGQGIAIASALVDLRASLGQLNGVAADETQPPEVRALAAVLAAAHARRPLTDADLDLLVRARTAVDARSLCVWALATQPKAHEKALLARLEVKLPDVLSELSDFLKARPTR